MVIELDDVLVVGGEPLRKRYSSIDAKSTRIDAKIGTLWDMH